MGLAVYSIGLGTAHTVILYSFLGRCFEFFVGIYLARCVCRGSRPSLGIPLTYLGFLGVATCVAGLVSLQSPETGIRFGLYHPLGIVINNFALPVFVALLIYGLIGEKTVAKFLLGTRLMDILGRSSYAFYLIHMGAIHVWVKNCLSGKGGYIYSVRFLALQVIAVALYILVEEPLRKLLRIRPTPQLRAANVEPSLQRAA